MSDWYITKDKDDDNEVNLHFTEPGLPNSIGIYTICTLNKGRYMRLHEFPVYCQSILKSIEHGQILKINLSFSEHVITSTIDTEEKE